jgi:hypothetical protein
LPPARSHTTRFRLIGVQYAPLRRALPPLRECISPAWNNRWTPSSHLIFYKGTFSFFIRTRAPPPLSYSHAEEGGGAQRPKAIVTDNRMYKQQRPTPRVLIVIPFYTALGTPPLREHSSALPRPPSLCAQTLRDGFLFFFPPPAGLYSPRLVVARSPTEAKMHTASPPSVPEGRYVTSKSRRGQRSQFKYTVSIREWRGTVIK